MEKATYKSSGVDLELYQQSMDRLPALMQRTFSPRVGSLDGGFAGLFELDFQNPLFQRKYDQPVMVSCTDGVGTKLKVANRIGIHFSPLQRGQNSGILSGGDVFSDSERAQLDEWMNEVYDVFKNHVVSIRGDRLASDSMSLASRLVACATIDCTSSGCCVEL